MSGIIAGPQVSWQGLREGLGADGRHLPKHFPLLVTEVLGVSPVLTGRFELNEPARAALAVDDERLQWALGLRVRSGGELVAELTTGAQAPYGVVRHPHLQELARAGTEEVPAKGVSGNWLVLASDAKALRRLAPYLALTRIEAETTAKTGTLALTSVDGAGPKLADFWRAWWQRGGRASQRELVGLLTELSAGRAAEELSRVAARASVGLEELLRGVERSRLDLAVEGSQLVLSGEHTTRGRWSSAKGACEAVAKSPQHPVLAAFAWGTDAEFDLPLDEGSLKLRGPALLGVADFGSALFGFADVGIVEPLDATARRLGQLFARASADSRHTDFPWTVASNTSGAGREWTFQSLAKPGAGGSQRSLRLLLGQDEQAADRARWVVTTEKEVPIPAWGSMGSELPWADGCERTIFGATLGVPPNRVALWGEGTKHGIELHGRAPIRSILDL